MSFVELYEFLFLGKFIAIETIYGWEDRIVESSSVFKDLRSQMTSGARSFIAAFLLYSGGLFCRSRTISYLIHC